MSSRLSFPNTRRSSSENTTRADSFKLSPITNFWRLDSISISISATTTLFNSTWKRWLTTSEKPELCLKPSNPGNTSKTGSRTSKLFDAKARRSFRSWRVVGPRLSQFSLQATKKSKQKSSNPTSDSMKGTKTSCPSACPFRQFPSTGTSSTTRQLDLWITWGNCRSSPGNKLGFLTTTPTSSSLACPKSDYKQLC